MTENEKPTPASEPLPLGPFATRIREAVQYRGPKDHEDYLTVAREADARIVALETENRRLRYWLTARPLRCGDVVKHMPTGETWEVAYSEAGKLSPAGWPECLADVADCEMIERCSDAEHVIRVAEWIAKPNGDHGPCLRSAKVRALYAKALQGDQNVTGT